MSAALAGLRPVRPGDLTRAQRTAIITLRGAASIRKVTNGWRAGGTPFIGNTTASRLISLGLCRVTRDRAGQHLELTPDGNEMATAIAAKEKA